MEQEVDKSKILYSIFHNDSQISFEVTDEVLLIANFLGNHPQILRSIYKAYRKLASEFTYSRRQRQMCIRDSKYIVDYYAYVWPIGQLPATRPMFISNMMIKRVVHQGLSHPLDETFSLDVLRATQLAKEQISTAYMPSKDGLAYYKHYAKDLFGIDLLEKEVK